MCQPRPLTIAALLSLLTLALGGCDGDSSNPMGPSGSIIIQAFQTSTQTEPNGIRVQVRMRVIEGLDALNQASRSGAARGQICLSGSCVDGSLAPTASEGICTGVQTIPVAGRELGLAAAWLDGDVVGVDFCARNLTTQEEFQTTVLDGMSQSNSIRTTCSPNGAFVICASG